MINIITPYLTGSASFTSIKTIPTSPATSKDTPIELSYIFLISENGIAPFMSIILHHM